MSYKLYESLQIKIYLTLDLDRSNQVNKVNFSHFHLKCLIPHLTSTHAGPTIEMWKKSKQNSTSRYRHFFNYIFLILHYLQLAKNLLLYNDIGKSHKKIISFY